MIREVAGVAVGLVLCAAMARDVDGRTQTAADKVPIVAVSGCLTERSPNTWMLTSATEPTPSVANAPATNAPLAGPSTGKGEFALIGISEFDLPSHKGHTVLVKALLIKGTPTSRLNVTSVTHISPTCPEIKKGEWGE